jgi:hypothetical protein
VHAALLNALYPDCVKEVQARVECTWAATHMISLRKLLEGFVSRLKELVLCKFYSVRLVDTWPGAPPLYIPQLVIVLTTLFYTNGRRRSGEGHDIWWIGPVAEDTALTSNNAGITYARRWASCGNCLHAITASSLLNPISVGYDMLLAPGNRTWPSITLTPKWSHFWSRNADGGTECHSWHKLFG